MKNSIDWLQK